MPLKPKVTSSDYYESLPSPIFRAGDIWRDLPLFGLLGRTHGTGVVITPACDLSNRKAETVTYLPVLPVTDYLCSMSLLPDAMRVLKGQAKAAELNLEKLEACRGFELPEEADIEVQLEEVCSQATSLPIGTKKRLAADRLLSGLHLLISMRKSGKCDDISNFHALYGEKESRKIVESIVRNNFRSDIHFLPSDGRLGDLSAMPSHSVVLFRYPLTLPCSMLVLAEDMTRTDWQQAIAASANTFPISRSLDARPLRISTIRPRFYSDVLARFVALFVRLGSPDFTDDTVETFSEEVLSKR